MTTAELVDGYFAVWNEPDTALRATRLAAIWADGAIYCDPSVRAEDAARFLSHIAELRSRQPGAVWRLLGTPDAHHDLIRFAWHVVDPAGVELRRGIDVIVVSGDGRRIARVYGFFDA